MKIKVQAQHLQPGDIVGSGEKVIGVTINSISWPSSKCMVNLFNDARMHSSGKRSVLWGKYTMINVERAE